MEFLHRCYLLVIVVVALADHQDDVDAAVVDHFVVVVDGVVVFRCFCYHVQKKGHMEQEQKMLKG